ncbi:MAG: glycosyltransferase family 4 protein [Patescibacteria group bacterium]|jgi:glycosyltransferase involved in cell wall biosynthesis
MKILTNIQTTHVAGISQVLWTLIKHLGQKKNNRIKIVGVDVCSAVDSSAGKIKYQDINPNFSQITLDSNSFPKFNEILKTAETVNMIQEAYGELIDKYREIIALESPDLILLNGTYYVPWLLYLAAKDTNTPIVLHYHGILTKEISHLEDRIKNLLEDLERYFDNDKLLYLFPSELAKNTVEKEVFKHEINKSAIIPNPIPNHFFDAQAIGSKKNVAFIGRLSAVKNPNFIKKLAAYNKKKKGRFKIQVVTDLAPTSKKIFFDTSVNIVKPMDTYKLLKFYEKTGLVISPSFFETYGNVAQEAIATGTPALVSNNMGVAETFKKIGLERLIVDFNSVADVYRHIGKFSGVVVSQEVRNRLREMTSGDKISSHVIKTLKNI